MFIRVVLLTAIIISISFSTSFNFSSNLLRLLSSNSFYSLLYIKVF